MGKKNLYYDSSKHRLGFGRSYGDQSFNGKPINVEQLKCFFTLEMNVGASKTEGFLLWVLIRRAVKFLITRLLNLMNVE
jgi:hypothetical protein